MASGRDSQRLIRLLNFLGIMNMVGIFCIILSEHSPTATTMSASGLPFVSLSSTRARSAPIVEKKKCQSIKSDNNKSNNNNNNSNRHKGINVTLIMLEKAGINVRMDYPRLPPWWWIEDQYGEEPKIIGLDRCQRFQMMNRHRLDQIQIAPVGLFNSGTNFLHQMLLDNCQLPHRPSAAAAAAAATATGAPNDHGRAFQPPWGKHTPREFRESHRIEHPVYKNVLLDAVLPIVLIRHPYDWLKSVCEQPYAVHWRDRDENKTIVCPWIVAGEGENQTTQSVIVTYGSGNIQYESVAHLWNRWNRGYYDTIAFPRIMVRMEDLIFYPQQVIPQLCKCAGGSLLHSYNDIQVPLESSKRNVPGHQQRLSTTYLQAVIKYGNLRTWDRFPLRDHVAARAILDAELMQTFGYEHPDLDLVVKRQTARREGVQSNL